MSSDDFSIIIPARLNSLRFKNKILFQILKLPMIEHVRRRAVLTNVNNSNIFVATSSKKIIAVIKKSKGNLLITKKKHLNGTSRVSEVINKIKTAYTIILQGDEPLFFPKDINMIIKKIIKEPNYDVYNTISTINKNQLLDESIVKCRLNEKKEIIDLFRKTKQKKYNNIKKILGIIVFKTDFLKKYKKLKESKNEKDFSIEQFKFLDNKIKIKSLYLKNNSQSVNYYSDLEKVINEYKINKNQKIIYNRIIN